MADVDLQNHAVQHAREPWGWVSFFRLVDHPLEISVHMKLTCSRECKLLASLWDEPVAS
jgi:hypothetical protein